GLALSLVLLVDWFAEQAKAAPLANALIDSTVEIGKQFAAGMAMPSTAAVAAGLAEGVLQSMKVQPSLAKFKPSRQPMRAGNGAAGKYAAEGPKAASASAALGGLRKLFWWSAAAGAVVLAGFLTLWLVWSAMSGDKETNATLARLKAVQRDWWDN